MSIAPAQDNGVSIPCQNATLLESSLLNPSVKHKISQWPCSFFSFLFLSFAKNSTVIFSHVEEYDKYIKIVHRKRFFSGFVLLAFVYIPTA